MKEFQDDKEMRRLERTLYQRELEEVGEALAEIEEDGRVEVRGANVWREKFNERKKETQVRLLRSSFSAFHSCLRRNWIGLFRRQSIPSEYSAKPTGKHRWSLRISSGCVRRSSIASKISRLPVPVLAGNVSSLKQSSLGSRERPLR